MSLDLFGCHFSEERSRLSVAFIQQWISFTSDEDIDWEDRTIFNHWIVKLKKKVEFAELSWWNKIWFNFSFQ